MTEPTALCGLAAQYPKGKVRLLSWNDTDCIVRDEWLRRAGLVGFVRAITRRPTASRKGEAVSSFALLGY